jgi:hypothetical protein
MPFYFIIFKELVAGVKRTTLSGMKLWENKLFLNESVLIDWPFVNTSQCILGDIAQA